MAGTSHEQMKQDRSRDGVGEIAANPYALERPALDELSEIQGQRVFFDDFDPVRQLFP